MVDLKNEYKVCIVIVYKTKMESETAAERQYRMHKEYMKAYYQRNREKLIAKQMERYKAANPNPRPVGRPRKVVVQTTGEVV